MRCGDNHWTAPPDQQTIIDQQAARIAELEAERDELRAIVKAIEAWSSNHQTIEAFRLFDEMRALLTAYAAKGT